MAATDPYAAPAGTPPEPLPLKGAGVGRRLVAQLIDTVILAWFFFGAVVAFGAEGPTPPATFVASFQLGGPNRYLTGMPVVVLIALCFAHYILLEGMLGATAGKAALRLRVVDAERSQVSLGRSTGRNLLRVIDVLPVFYLVGAIAIWSTSANQRLGDLAAKTYVVRR